MDINEFLSAYEDIVKGVASDQIIERTFNELFERVEGTYLEEDFRKADDKIGRIMCIDKAAHYIHSRDADLLAFAFPDADPTFVKDTLDRLSGLEAVSPVRKASRGYFTTFASAEGLEFLQKQVGSLKKTRASRDEVKEDIAEYERLFKAGIASHAELLTLSRYHGDKGQRYLDEVKKKSFTPDDPMVVGGYASVEVVDKEGHLITTEALEKAFSKFMDSFRTRNIQFAHCLTGDTLVWKTHGGYTPISEIKEGDHVYTHTGKSRQVLKTLILKSCMPINVLELENGEVIRITDEHEVFTKRGWITANDLTVDDVLMKTKPAGVIIGNEVACDAKRGKTLVEFYGEEKASQMKKDISSKSSTRIRFPDSKETKQKKSVSTKKSWTSERKQSASLEVRNNPRGFCLKNDSDERKGKTWIEMYGHERPNYGGNAGEKNTNWKGGIARLPYPFEFHVNKKEEIRVRDGYRCQRCGKTQEVEISEFGRKLSVHHIDYIKKHSSNDNLISLCNKCNSEVNFERDYWRQYFTKILQPVLVTNGTSIRSIKKESYDGWVYNIQVDVDNSYSGKGIIYHNSDVQAGWPLKVWINNAGEIYRSGVDDKGLYLVSEVRPDSTIANKVEKEIAAGIIRSYSIAGSALDKSVETKNGRVIMVVNDLELQEVSFCERPVNQESNFDIIKGYSAGKDAILGKTIDTKGPNPTMGLEPSLGEVFKAEGEGSTQLVGMSDAELKTLGEKAGANFDAVDFKEFKMGLKVEQEHYDLTGMDPFKTAKIVLAHMRELKDYYTQLDAMEKRGEKVVKAVSHKDELMQFFTDHPAPDDKEVHAFAEKLKIEPDALEEEIYSLLADELGKGSVTKSMKGLSLGEKCKAVFKVSEDDLTRDEQSQNDATLRKEMSHGIDHGSNKTVQQSPDVQTPVTKIGEISMGKTGLKEFKKFVDKSELPRRLTPAQRDARRREQSGFNDTMNQGRVAGSAYDKMPWLNKPKETKKACDGLKDYVDRNVNIKKKQPPAMAPPKSGLSWNPVTHRWVKPLIQEGRKISKSITEEEVAGIAAFIDFMKGGGKI